MWLWRVIKNPWNLIFSTDFSYLFHFKGRTFCLTVVTGIASWHLNLICRTFAGMVITTTLCFTCYFCRFAWNGIAIGHAILFLAETLATGLICYFPPTWILSLQQESSLLYAQFTTEQSSLVMFVPPSDYYFCSIWRSGGNYVWKNISTKIITIWTAQYHSKITDNIIVPGTALANSSIQRY